MYIHAMEDVDLSTTSDLHVSIYSSIHLSIHSDDDDRWLSFATEQWVSEWVASCCSDCLLISNNVSLILNHHRINHHQFTRIKSLSIVIMHAAITSSIIISHSINIHTAVVVVSMSLTFHPVKACITATTTTTTRAWAELMVTRSLVPRWQCLCRYRPDQVHCCCCCCCAWMH